MESKHQSFVGAIVGLMLIVTISLLGLFTLTGRRVSQVFTSINSGLGDGPTGYNSAPAAPPADSAPARPVATPPRSAEVPTPAPDAAMPRRVQGNVAPIKAGERDDNADFASYQQFVSLYDWRYSSLIAERYHFRVNNRDQLPLRNVDVELFADGQRIAKGRTYANGEVLLIPQLTTNLTDQQLTYVVQYGGSKQERPINYPECTECVIDVTFDQPAPASDLTLDLLFMLDTTGSMDDELARIQETIQSIATRIDGFQPRPVIRFGLIAYRDHGDAYVTRSYDFTRDLDAFQAVLNSLDADGGGDTPEALNEALAAAVQNQGFSWGDDSIRLTFLVADASPHSTEYRTSLDQFIAYGIKIYPIAASGSDDLAEFTFRELAQRTLGRFIFLTYQEGQDSGAPGETTTLNAGDQPYTVDRLDDLIVQTVERELRSTTGK